MKVLNLYFVLIVLLFSCARESQNCLPMMVIESNKDQVSIGDEIIFRVTISDTSFLSLNEPDMDKTMRIHPVFKVNGNVVENLFSDTLVYREIADSISVYPDKPSYREVDFSVIIPHPIEFEGAIELKKVESYMVD